MRRRDVLTRKRDAARKRAARAAVRADPDRLAVHLAGEREREAVLRSKRRARGAYSRRFFWMTEGLGISGRLKRLSRVCAWAGLGAKRSTEEQLTAGWAAHDAWLESLDRAD